MVASILVVTFLLSAILFSLWLRSGKKIEEVITQQFNEQQLMLARKIADNIEAYIDFMELLATTYTQEYYVEAGSPGHLETFLNLQLQYLQSFGVLAIIHYQAAGQVAAVYTSGDTARLPVATPLAPTYLQWAQEAQNRQVVFLQQVFPLAFADGTNRRVLGILTPLYRPGQSASPTAADIFSGVIQIIVDPYFIAAAVSRDVRSGQTGYAWIIDHQGTFLAHYENSFVGRDHVAIRRLRNPAISYDKLEELVKQRLLKGQEGSDYYYSGWHRDRIGEIKKLLAYTPVTFQRGLKQNNLQVENAGANFWGVGVAAPVEEVAGLVGRLQFDQGLIIGSFLLFLIGSSSVLIGAIYSWNRVLSHEVAEKTEELGRSHERLLRSERFAAVGQAAAYVSHEIKNPLMVIGGFAQQLKRNPEIPPAAQTKLEIISGEVKRLENFLGELRDFTRPAPAAKQEADLNDLVSQVVTMMTDAAQDMGIQLVTRLAADLPPLSFDTNQLKQVLINLIKNAMEAMEGGGTITVTTEARPDQVLLGVHDTGKGIPADVLPNIFNPFFTTKKTGTGLGLAVTNKIIEDHQGSISVTSSAEQGTTFTVALPYRR